MIIPFNNTNSFALKLPISFKASDYFKALDEKLIRLGLYSKLDNYYGRKLAYDEAALFSYREELLKESDEIASKFVSLKASTSYSYEVDFIFDLLESMDEDDIEALKEINEINLLIKGVLIAIKEGKTFKQIQKLINDCYNRIIDECMYWDIITIIFTYENAAIYENKKQKGSGVGDDT